MSSENRESLLGNALDYLLLALEMATQDSPRMLKHSCANLADGLELLLKARLESYDWRLVCEDGNTSREDYDKGEFRSTAYSNILKLLGEHCSVTISPQHLEILTAIRSKRNKIRHFTLAFSKEEVFSNLWMAYGVALDFIGNNLQSDVEQSHKYEIKTIQKELGSLAAFVEHRLNEIASVLQGQEWHVKCQRCLQKTLFSSEKMVSCPFCGYSALPGQATVDWKEIYFGIRRMKDWLGVENVYCPECGADAIPLDEDDGCRCFECGEESIRNECLVCGERTFDTLCDYHQHQADKEIYK